MARWARGFSVGYGCVGAVTSAFVLLGTAQSARADQTLTFEGTVMEGELDHEFVEFDVPEGVAEIQVEHDDLSGEDILDWGLNDPNGFRGWGGGNSEPAVVGVSAASRSYLAGPIVAGKWKVVIGKAQIGGGSANYQIVVTLRDVATLPPQPERAPYVESPPLASTERFYAGDLHVHSRESGDASPSIEDVVLFAKSQQLDFVELSEHNTVSQLDFISGVQAAHKDVLILPGVEYTTYAGHANGIGATVWVDHKIGQPGVDIAGAAKAFRDQGALFSLNHPRLDLGNLCIGCAWDHDVSAEAIDAVEIATSGAALLLIDDTLAFWDSLCDTGRHIAPVGGSDDHTAGKDDGQFSSPVGKPATYVYAKELSVPALIEGIRNSRTVVKLDGVTGPMVDLTSEIPREGDTVFAERTKLTAKVSQVEEGAAVRWIKNGEEVFVEQVSGDPFESTLEVSVPTEGQDRYRVEVARSGKPITITGYLWVEFKEGVGVEPETPTPESNDGCSCRTAPVKAPDGWVGLGLLGPGLVWARRRRRS
ncbi:MAG: PHP domain-containing protein [Polyangiaceae bacterium]|nr:PHP domain-containing protein [Polyangiaceae bacterium]